VIENDILNYFNGLNGEEVIIDRGTYATNMTSDMSDVGKIVVIIGLVISILIALSNQSGTALVFAVIMGFIVFIVLLSGKKTRYHVK
jgi:cell division protein FtsW (lipid II flippase)